jgi:hypothetical protein
MSKPFIVQQEGSRWALYLEPDAARRYGGSTTKKRLAKYGSERLAVIVGDSGGVKALDPNGRGTRMSKKEAEDVAGHLGNMLGLGSMSYAYTEVRHEPKTSGDRRRRHRSASAPTFSKQRYVSRKIRILRNEGYPPRQAEAIAYRYAGEPRRRARSRRDPTESKTLRTKRLAIERAIKKLAASAMTTGEAHDAGEKIRRAIDRYEYTGRQEGDAHSSETGTRLWREVVAAKDQAKENYSAGLRTQLSEANERVRASRPAPGTYEHELALHGVRGKRDRLRRRRVRRDHLSTSERARYHALFREAAEEDGIARDDARYRSAAVARRSFDRAIAAKEKLADFLETKLGPHDKQLPIIRQHIRSLESLRASL